MTNLQTATAPSARVDAPAPDIADSGMIRLGATFRLTAKTAPATTDAGRIRPGATFRLV